MKRPLRLILWILFTVTMLSGPVFAQTQPEDPGMVRLRYATIVVPDYEEALRWYTGVLGLEKVQDGSFGGGLRWIVVAPRGVKDFGIVLELARPIDENDPIHNYKDRVGKETRWVFEVEDCHKTYELLSKRGVKFIDKPTDEPWGVKAQFEDLYGNVFVINSSKRAPSH